MFSWYPYPHVMHTLLFYDHFIFLQLSVNECVNYKQCLNSLQTALVCSAMSKKTVDSEN